jgi:ADP-ribosylglycohydrolase
VSIEHARRSLDGLSVGDAFGERFFVRGDLAVHMIESRAVPAAPWRYTDDTEMALAIFDELAARGTIDRDSLARAFARRYVRDRMRGYGATAHQILTAIAMGEPWRSVAGVVFGGTGSKGNGGAMRAGPLGAFFAGDLERAAREAEASAEVTHAHRDGQAGAIAVAVAASHVAASEATAESLFDAVLAHTPAGPTRNGLLLARGMRDEDDLGAVVRRLGNGSSVISEDTVPFAIWSAARHLDDFEEAMWRTVAALGDRDTTCAIVGGIVALSTRAPIPAAWLEAREHLEFESGPGRRGA